MPYLGEDANAEALLDIFQFYAVYTKSKVLTINLEILGFYN